MPARRPRAIRDNRRGAAHPAASGSTRPPLREAARSAAPTAALRIDPAGTATLGSEFSRDRSLPVSKRESRRSSSANSERTSNPPSSRTTRATVPIVGKDSSSTRFVKSPSAAVSRDPGRRPQAGRWAPCQRRSPVAAARSVRDSTVSSAAVGAVAPRPIAGGRAHPRLRPPPRPPVSRAPVRTTSIESSPPPQR